LVLGFMVGHRGIQANPIKVDVIHNMVKPSCKKDVEAHRHDGGPMSHQQARWKRSALLQAIEEGR
jgi:hypothetical protein